MSSPVIAVQNKEELLNEVAPKSKEKLLVLAFMRTLSYSSTCEYMKPFLDSVAANNEFKDKVEFCTIDVDNNEFKDMVRVFQVQAVPSFRMIKDNKVVKKLTTTDKHVLTNSITNIITNSITT